LRAPRPAQRDGGGGKRRHLSSADFCCQFGEAVAREASDDVGTGSALSGNQVGITKSIFFLSMLALLWTASTWTRTAMLAERWTEVVQHLCQEALELREDSAGFFIGAMGGELNSPEEKILS
jgi:hypothetical protein